MFVFVMSDPFSSMGTQCSICKQNCGFEGVLLRGGFTGPFTYWVCLDCDDWLVQIARHNYTQDEGPK
ncbi:hypothetical protein BTR25_23125 [Bacillus sp. MRMR6]|nr:hypothetical protein BTR25_23125 [Bacillus sp. MRMR6]